MKSRSCLSPSPWGISLSARASIRTIGASRAAFLRAAASVIVQRVLEQAHANGGNIVLLHDGGGDRSHTVEALPQIIDGLRAAGFQIVPVSELVGQTRAQLMPPLSFRERLVAHADGLVFTLYEWSRLSVAFIFVLGIGLVSCRAIVVGVLAIIEKFRPAPPDHPEFQPLVSVLIPAYNEMDVIAYTVNSALESDYPEAGSDRHR